jgi:hypothetical protein
MSEIDLDSGNVRSFNNFVAPNRDPPTMKTLARKSKMVSFRLKPEEYQKFLNTCETLGVPSVSELARTAVCHLNATGQPPTVENLCTQIQELRDQLSVLTSEIIRLAQHIESR